LTDAKKLSIAVLLVSIVVSFFVAFNGQEINVKISMLAYATMAAVLIALISGAGRSLNFSLVGESITVDVIKGAAAGVAFIVLNNLNNALSLGAPAALLSLEPAFLLVAICVVAPIVEEFFFRGLLYPFLYKTTGSNIISMPLQGAIFALYHFAVYGGFLGLNYSPGIFIGAFVFGTAMSFLVKQSGAARNITTLEAPIIAHAIFNGYLLNLTARFIQL